MRKTEGMSKTEGMTMTERERDVHVNGNYEHNSYID